MTKQLNLIARDIASVQEDDSFQFFGCTAEGRVKVVDDVEDGVWVGTCDDKADVLQRAVTLWTTDAYRACDYTTISSTATSSVTSQKETTATSTLTSSATSSITSTVTSTDHGKLFCNTIDSTTYIEVLSDCDGQVDVLNEIAKLCDPSIGDEGSGEYFSIGGSGYVEEMNCSVLTSHITVLKGSTDGPCSEVAAALNLMADRMSFPERYTGGTLQCDSEGYLTSANQTQCESTIPLLNRAIAFYLADMLPECKLTTPSSTDTSSATSSLTSSASSTVSATVSSSASSTQSGTATSSASSTQSGTGSSTATSSATSSASTTVSGSDTSTASSTVSQTGTSTASSTGSSTASSTATAWNASRRCFMTMVPRRASSRGRRNSPRPTLGDVGRGSRPPPAQVHHHGLRRRLPRGLRGP